MADGCERGGNACLIALQGAAQHQIGHGFVAADVGRHIDADIRMTGAGAVELARNIARDVFAGGQEIRHGDDPGGAHVDTAVDGLLNIGLGQFEKRLARLEQARRLAPEQVAREMTGLAADEL